MQIITFLEGMSLLLPEYRPDLATHPCLTTEGCRCGGLLLIKLFSLSISVLLSSLEVRLHPWSGFHYKVTSRSLQYQANISLDQHLQGEENIFFSYMFYQSPAFTVIWLTRVPWSFMNYDERDEISQMSDRNQETGSALLYNILRELRRVDSPNKKQERSFCQNKEERGKHTLKYTNKNIYVFVLYQRPLSVKLNHGI